MDTLQGQPCLGHQLLILGDVNTGKTTLCRRLLAGLCAQGFGARCCVLDLAPHIPHALALQKGLKGVGGALFPPPGARVQDLRAHLDPPRLSSSSEEEAMRKAERNAETIDTLLARLPGSGRDILFINDVTLYLQAGSVTHLLDRISAAAIGTLVVNGYWGERLGGGALTQREKNQTLQLRQHFERQGQAVILTQRHA